MANGPGQMEVYRSADGAEIAVVAATWHLNPKVTFESLKLEFDRNSDRAWRNYGSKLKVGIEKAIDPELVNRHANRSRLHPFDPAAGTFATWFRGEPGLSYFMHLDLAKNRDRAGISLVHKSRVSGKWVVDFMDGVQSRNGKDISISGLRDTYVYGLTALGFHIARVTVDQWQSALLQEELQARGYEVAECSADKKTGPYDTLIDLIESSRLDYYLHPLLVKEMGGLRKIGNKWDHGKGGTKDLADAVACACFQGMEYLGEHPDVGGAFLSVNRAHSGPAKRGLD